MLDRLLRPEKKPEYHRQGPVPRWVLLLGALFLVDGLTFLAAEGLWFQEVHYLSLFWVRFQTQAAIGIIVTSVSLIFCLVQLSIAARQAWSDDLPESDRSHLSGSLGLNLLLPLLLLLSLLLSSLLLYHGEIAWQHWHPNLGFSDATLPIPERFRFQACLNLVQSPTIWRIALVIGFILLLLLQTRGVLFVAALLLSLSMGLALSEHWSTLLLARHPVAFGTTDPLFGRDLRFYIFSFPLWELLAFWLTGLMGLVLVAVSLLYLLSGKSIVQGSFPGFTAPQQRHLLRLGGYFMLLVAVNYWIDRYKLLFSPKGATYGASYINVTLELPLYTALSVGAGLIALVLLIRSLSRFGSRAQRVSPQDTPSTRLRVGLLQPGQPPLPSAVLVPQPRILFMFGIYALVVLGSWLLPIAIQRLVVQPNELRLELPYIQHTLALTRRAFNLETVDVETFNPENGLSAEDLQRNRLTIDNIRIWDKRPLLETNRQLQRIRPYYEFPDADIDRYPLAKPDGSTSLQQVLIAARELDSDSVPAAAQTWVNRHLTYTHGYGFTVSPVNIAAEGGLPDYLIAGIEPNSADPRIRNSIPVGKPRLYYGELTNTYVMTDTQVKELDYPSGTENVYNTYSGRGGVGLGAWWQRLIFAKHLRDWRMLLTNTFTPETRLLFRRNINSRIRAIAPFLRYDSDPYLVVANTGNTPWQHGQPQRSVATSTPDESYLYWIIDAYTVSDRFPYSDPLSRDFNYIRNSVKVVVDAYHGTVTFYAADEQDPILKAWKQIFPGMFRSLNEMPTVLRQHVRYPQDLYRVQSDQLMTYHITDPVVFYNREDQWRAPNEIYGGQQQRVEPYYLIMKLPIGNSEEFILLRLFTPAQRNNLIAWLAARSDGSQYGKMLLYIFPKQELVFGPEQIEARINQDPVISQQISLWNRQGSRAIQGNLLVIPIGRSLLYVEPLYLEAEQNQLPILARVIVVYGNRIAMAETLPAALQAIFQPNNTPEPIVRPVGESAPQ